MLKRKTRGRKRPLSSSKRRKKSFLRLHPLFLLVGAWYAFRGKLFLFFVSALVAIQHECAHAFASAKLGYRLNEIVLMPFGAILDGDLRGISFKDEIFVALCAPLCNLATAAFFVAIWWFAPTVYAFTDVAFEASLSIALVNLLPAYPLDGGRVLRCALARAFLKTQPRADVAERKADVCCRALTFVFSLSLLVVFALQLVFKTPNVSLGAFGAFLFVSALGNKNKDAIYAKIDFSMRRPMEKGVEIRRIALLSDCPLKNALRFLERGTYLVLEVYDEGENKLFELTQNELAALALIAATPYEGLRSLRERAENGENLR